MILLSKKDIFSNNIKTFLSNFTEACTYPYLDKICEIKVN